MEEKKETAGHHVKKDAEHEKKEHSHKHEEKVVEHKTDTKVEHDTHSGHHAHSARHHTHSRHENLITKPIIALMFIAVLLVLFNQSQISTITAMSTLDTNNLGGSTATGGSGSSVRTGSLDLAAIDVSTLKSTGHTIAAVFPVVDIVTADDALAIMFPTGTPDYGEELDVSYDDPVESLETLARMYRGLKAEVQKSNPEGWQRYMNLASKPVGISCEYCCGVGPIGINARGDSACGCQHNPAVLSVALYLSAYSDYNDGEILREVMRWKTLFFPKNMIELGTSLAGGDTSSLKDLPGMVGGC